MKQDDGPSFYADQWIEPVRHATRRSAFPADAKGILSHDSLRYRHQRMLLRVMKSIISGYRFVPPTDVVPGENPAKLVFRVRKGWSEGRPIPRVLS